MWVASSGEPFSWSDQPFIPPLRAFAASYRTNAPRIACIDGSTECVRRLLRAGASPVPPDAWGRDPAAVARQLGREGPLRLLEAFKDSTGPGSGSGARGSASVSTVGLPLENGAAENERRSARARKARLHGDRWVVMNEGGRMLERASGKVRYEEFRHDSFE